MRVFHWDTWSGISAQLLHFFVLFNFQQESFNCQRKTTTARHQHSTNINKFLPMMCTLMVSQWDNRCWCYSRYSYWIRHTGNIHQLWPKPNLLYVYTCVTIVYSSCKRIYGIHVLSIHRKWVYLVAFWARCGSIYASNFLY